MISFIPVLTVMGTIFLLSHTTGAALPIDLHGFDKLLHIIAYTALGLSALFAVRERYRKNPYIISLAIILFCLVYGISDEFHQSFIPGRTPSFLDLVADLTGGVVAVTAWGVWAKKAGHNNIPPVEL